MDNPWITDNGGTGITTVVVQIEQARRLLREQLATTPDVQSLIELLNSVLDGFGPGRANDVKSAREALGREQWPGGGVAETIGRACDELARYRSE